MLVVLRLAAVAQYAAAQSAIPRAELEVVVSRRGDVILRVCVCRRSGQETKKRAGNGGNGKNRYKRRRMEDQKHVGYITERYVHVETSLRGTGERRVKESKGMGGRREFNRLAID